MCPYKFRKMVVKNPPKLWRSCLVSWWEHFPSFCGWYLPCCPLQLLRHLRKRKGIEACCSVIKYLADKNFSKNVTRCDTIPFPWRKPVRDASASQRNTASTKCHGLNGPSHLKLKLVWAFCTFLTYIIVLLKSLQPCGHKIIKNPPNFKYFSHSGFRLLDIYNVNVMDRTVAVEVLHQLRWEDARYF